MKLLRRSTLPIISLLLVLLPKKVVNACGFMVTPGEYRFWLLQPDLTNMKDLTPFFFATSYLYKGNQFAGQEIYQEQNVNEWYREVKQKVPKGDIDTLLNYTNPELFFNDTTGLASGNKFLRYLLQPGNRELFRYIVLSKKIEEIVANPDPWQEDQIPSAILKDLITEADDLYKSAKLPFVMLRTLYQLERLHIKNREKAKAEEIFNSQIKPVKTDSWIRTAALFQIAVNTQGLEGNYLLSKVFDLGNYNRVTCLVYFNSEKLDSILPLAKNNHERTVLNAMKVFNYSGRSLRNLRDIYRNEPGYKELPFLLLREINKVEDWLVTSKVSEFAPATYWYSDEIYNPAVNYLQDKAYASELYNFINQLISEGVAQNLPLLNLCAAHLAMISGKYETSLQHLDSAYSKNLPLNMKTQIRIDRLLLSMEMQKSVGKSAEDELFSIVSSSDEQLGIYDPDIMKDQLILFTARKMIAKGNKARGLMLLSKTERAIGDLPIGDYKRVYQVIEEKAGPRDYDEIIDILQRKNKTAFEKFISEDPFKGGDSYYDDRYNDRRWDINKLLDNKASWYIRNNELRPALAVLRQIPAEYWNQKPYTDYIIGDPFYVNFYHSHIISKDEKMRCNKIEVIIEMIRLEDIANTQPGRAADCYYQLANAWYNMSYYGKNWLMVKQWWSSGEPIGSPESERKAFDEMYYGCTRAKEYYLRALKETKDQKLAALCCFMAQKCQNNFENYKWQEKGDYNAEFNPSAGRFVKNLKQKGFDDSYYKEIVHECATYNSFVRAYYRLP